MSARALDRVVACAIAVVVVVVLAATASDVGFTRDEGYYFKAGELYAQWWRLLATQPLQALSATAINEHLAYNPEHPFVMKGISPASTFPSSSPTSCSCSPGFVFGTRHGVLSSSVSPLVSPRA